MPAWLTKKQKENELKLIVTKSKSKNKKLANKKRLFSKAIGEQALSDSDESDEDKENDKCGLRNISEKVMQVLLEKHTTTYKEVSDFITSNEAEKLELGEATQTGPYGNLVMSSEEESLKRQEANRKRIKNLRRRVYDSLNVFLACDIFIKDKKQVTFNMDYYECLPEQYKVIVQRNQSKFGYTIPET